MPINSLQSNSEMRRDIKAALNELIDDRDFERHRVKIQSINKALKGVKKTGTESERNLLVATGNAVFEVLNAEYGPVKPMAPQSGHVFPEGFWAVDTKEQFNCAVKHVIWLMLNATNSSVAKLGKAREFWTDDKERFEHNATVVVVAEHPHLYEFAMEMRIKRREKYLKALDSYLAGRRLEGMTRLLGWRAKRADK